MTFVDWCHVSSEPNENVFQFNDIYDLSLKVIIPNKHLIRYIFVLNWIINVLYINTFGDLV